MEENSIMILNSNDVMPTNADGVMGFKQNSDLFYLSGIDQEETTLILQKTKTTHAYLFLRETSDLVKIWEGEKLTKEQASSLSGIQNCLWQDQFERTLSDLLLKVNTLYLNTNEHVRANTPVQSRDDRFLHEHKVMFTEKKITSAASLIYPKRFLKQTQEVAQIETAIDITKDAFLSILPKFKSYEYEFEVEADITHKFLLRRSRGHAYQPIIAGGVSACVLHYVSNNNKLTAGDLVLMDFGAEYGNYNADLTRTIPVNGVFTDRQKHVYSTVLHILKEATKQLVIGNTWERYNQFVKELMDQGLVELGLLTVEQIASEDPKNPAMRKHFMHGTSHSLGIDVHDVDDRSIPFKAGMVFTVEPGIYITEEKIGIRLENNIHITPEGPVNMMASIPIELEEIETLMK